MNNLLVSDPDETLTDPDNVREAIVAILKEDGTYKVLWSKASEAKDKDR